MLAKIKDLLGKLNIVSNNVVRTTPLLGRWCILNKEFNNRKIDMANIDHCGTCHYDYKKEAVKVTEEFPTVKRQS